MLDRETLAAEARALRVYMTHTPQDEEFMQVLSYRVDQKIAAVEGQLVALKALREKYSA